MNTITDIRAALAKIDAALKPSDEDLKKANQLGAAFKHPEIIEARAIWDAARKGACKRYLVAHLSEIIERRTNVYSPFRVDNTSAIDWHKCEESIWSLYGPTAEDFALDVADGGHGAFLWQHVTTADSKTEYHPRDAKY